MIELEKVNELCKDFSQRYSTCLSVKLSSENIFKCDTDDASDDINESVENDSYEDENEDASNQSAENNFSYQKKSSNGHLNPNSSTPLSHIGIKPNQENECMYNVQISFLLRINFLKSLLYYKS